MRCEGGGWEVGAVGALEEEKRVKVGMEAHRRRRSGVRVGDVGLVLTSSFNNF